MGTWNTESKRIKHDCKTETSGRWCSVWVHSKSILHGFLNVLGDLGFFKFVLLLMLYIWIANFRAHSTPHPCPFLQKQNMSMCIWNTWCINPDCCSETHLEEDAFTLDIGDEAGLWLWRLQIQWLSLQRKVLSPQERPAPSGENKVFAIVLLHTAHHCTTFF